MNLNPAADQSDIDALEDWLEQMAIAGNKPEKLNGLYGAKMRRSSTVNMSRMQHFSNTALIRARRRSPAPITLAKLETK